MEFTASHHPLRIFVVENDTVLLPALETHLTLLGHEVNTARDLREALHELPSNPSDLLLCDLKLPDGTGWQLLRELGPQRPAVAVAMSGYCSAPDLARSHRAGFDHHLIKPFSPGELTPILDQTSALCALSPAPRSPRP